MVYAAVPTRTTMVGRKLNRKALMAIEMPAQIADLGCSAMRAPRPANILICFQ